MKTLYIMRGIPGSSKSTLASFIYQGWINRGFTASIHSTDNYFMVDGIYKFDFNKLGYYHRLNLEASEADMKNGINCIIVDNTNITPSAYKDYLKHAETHGYDHTIVKVGTPLEICKSRNNTRSSDRKIPDDVIENMFEKLKNSP